MNPFRLLAAPQIAEILPILVAKGRLHFVINGHLPDNTSTDQITDTVLRQLDEIPSDQNRYEASSSNPSISFLRANKALRAWDALAIGLEAGGTISRARTEAFDTFQRQFLRSGVGALQASLLSLARAQTSPQLGTASRTAELALAYIGSTICADRTATSTAAQTVADLRHAADKGGNRAKHSSVVHRGISGGTVDGDVQHEMNRARRDLEKSFAGRWGWLSLIGRLRVDDVGSEVSDYLARQFGRNLERQVRAMSHMRRHV